MRRRGPAVAIGLAVALACAACHLADLAGTLAGDAGAPPLRGDAFVAFVEGGNARRLFEYVKSTMPADDPASLPEAAYLEVLAYLFQANGFPSGSVDLDIEQLSAIRLTGNR